jgi:Na+/proline symporter
LLGDRDLPWWTIGLSIMATQASAITFLSTPGQAYEDGMRFAQFYFGLPVAMVFLSVFVLPIYYKLKVYTAYEYLEGRFDLKTRTMTAMLFLLQRGLAAGLTIYAPAIILSSILNWPLTPTTLFIGIVVIFYTMMGGTKAVSVTQKQQMIVILTGMFIAAVILVFQLPKDVSFTDAVGVAGKMGKLNVVDFDFDLSNRYTFWSGMLGGVFLFLSYFGTDQSQVQRYLSGKSLTESRLGLLFNGILKVPMQFLVLFVGILVFVFFQFNHPPVHFNTANVDNLRGTAYEEQYEQYSEQYAELNGQKESEIRQMIQAMRTEDEATLTAAQSRYENIYQQESQIREEVKELISAQNPAAKTEDTDYVFITFVTTYLPIGLVGLLLAVIFSAAMSSTASELNALATTTVIDIYRRSLVPDKSDRHYLNASKWFTILWGATALMFALIANLFDNLIEAVNIIGSLFYGVILGIFVVAFFMKRIRGNSVFIAAIVSELIVILIFTLDNYGIISIAYLWLNLIGCVLVMIFSQLFYLIRKV